MVESSLEECGGNGTGGCVGWSGSYFEVP